MYTVHTNIHMYVYVQTETFANNFKVDKRITKCVKDGGDQGVHCRKGKDVRDNKSERNTNSW